MSNARDYKELIAKLFHPALELAAKLKPAKGITDPDEALCRHFDVIHEKTLYGRKFMGVVRSTFLIDAAGKLRGEWRKVKVKGHVAEVLDAVKALK